ncbi:hypothetical protein TrLO_g6759 [Triparma laevis f. longispina]|uniref:Uncharacterized protein n=1 Tax=Triparma laevis f. longispina TaxID=1714387 RepID=A0A9W7FDW3_9STRA|nr:hypothetical protein TrLO_g6759 [Triparma laevis f. longispina]
MKTSIPALQTYLTSLIAPIESEDKQKFVELFVPLDVTSEDITGFLGDLNSSPSQWLNLTSEIRVIESGEGVERIEEEDGGKKIIFYFEHPLLEGCDREVEFVLSGEPPEWRAGG